MCPEYWVHINESRFYIGNLIIANYQYIIKVVLKVKE